MRNNHQLPSTGHPILCRALEGKTFAFSTMPPHVKAGLHTRLTFMGGICVPTFDQSVDYLITPRVGSVNYKLACKLGVPVLHPLYIQRCWEARKQLPIDDFKLPPFAGLMISVTGFSQAMRAQLQQLVEGHGGVYTPHLSKRCTHLLSKSTLGLKFRYATEWGIFRVTPDWLYTSINAQCCAHEANFQLKLSEEQRYQLFNTNYALHRLSAPLREKHLSQQQQKRNIKGKTPAKHCTIKRSNTTTKRRRRQYNKSHNLVEVLKSTLTLTNTLIGHFKQQPECSAVNQTPMEVLEQLNKLRSMLPAFGHNTQTKLIAASAEK